MAPGNQLRDGLERILRGNTGGLIVLGYDDAWSRCATGGFELDVEFSATRLRELSKMDGAVVLSTDQWPDRAGRTFTWCPTRRSPPTSRAPVTARPSGSPSRPAIPVISVSQSMRIIALYVDGRRYVLDDSAAILSRANQALATLERYKLRLDEVAGTLSALEIEDLVTVRDAVAVSQRLEMVLPHRRGDRAATSSSSVPTAGCCRCSSRS